MENKNTIELNVVRLGGGNGGSQPTKLSELENDCGFIQREAFTEGKYQKTATVVLYENEDEAKVVTKTKGMKSISLSIIPSAVFGTTTKTGIQLIFKDLEGNEFLRLPNKDGWIEEGAMVEICVLNDPSIGNSDIDIPGAALNYGYYDALPSEFELYIQSRSGGERHFDLVCEIDGAMSIDSKFDQKQDTLKSGGNIKTINGVSLLGGGDIEIGGLLTGRIYHDYQDGSAYSYKIPLNVTEKRLIQIQSYMREVTMYLTDDMAFDTRFDIGNNIGAPGSFLPYILFEPCSSEVMKVTISEARRNINKVYFIDPNVSNVLSVETDSGNLDLSITQHIQPL